MKLETSLVQYEELHKLLDTKRRKTKMTNVPTQLLINLLIDHSRMYSKLKDMGVSIEDD
jgi:hypothetical protein